MNKVVVAFVGAVFAVGSLAGCQEQSTAGPTPAETQVAKAALNASPKTSDFIFEAQNSIALHSAPLTVTGGDVGARGTGTVGPFLAGGVAIDIASGANVQTTRSIIADSIKLNTGIVVGDLQVNRLVNPSSGTHGTVTPLVPLPALPAPAAVSPGTQNLNVTGTTTANPGKYQTVTMGTNGVLKLKAGTYEIKDLTGGTKSRIEALGPVQIRIANRFKMGSSFFIGAASGVTLTAKDIRIEVSGQNGTTGALSATPKAAVLDTGGCVRALILAPNGTLSLASKIDGKGAFMARDIDVGSEGAKYTYEDGFPSGATCTPQSCNDNNPCTTDVCGANGVCTKTPVAAGTACGDGNACNGAETCNASGVCQAGTPVTCTASDQCHVAGTCDQATGACSNPTKTDGVTCDDGDGCTTAEACHAGMCNGGTSKTCTAQDQCHVAGTCDPTSGACSNPAKTDGTSCSDGNACTQVDTCQAGSCSGASPVTCTASDQCHVAGLCDPTSGVCTNPTILDGTACNDGDACTMAEACHAGACNGGTSKTCTAQDQCHVAGTCDPTSGGCSNPTKPDDTACNDGDACTTAEACHAGTCNGGTSKTCTAQDQCHVAGTCDPTSGACSNPTKPDDTACNDGDACTTAEACHAGTCNGGTSKTCTAQDQCHVAGTCDPTSGACSDPTKPDDTACNDGDACTTAEACHAGTCNGGTAKTCTAQDQCHVAGTCDPTSGACSDPTKPDGTACTDGNVCTQTDTCQAGVCGGSSLALDDGNPCTADGCDAGGGVSHTQLPAGTSCSGGPACSGAEVCDAQGACVPVDDANSCTVDVCDPGAGVNHVAVAAGTPCANSPSCPGAATCDSSGACSACIVGQLKLFHRQVEVPYEGTLTVPEVLAGSRGVVVPLTLSNVGNGDLIVSGSPNITIIGPNSGDFTIQKFPPGILGAGSSASIELKFIPSGGGTRTASLQIASNDAAHPTFVISLTGNGLLPADLDPNTNGSWAAGTVKACNTREARVMARTGDIDNLGFGFPVAFDPFSGFNTPVHGFPWAVNPIDPAGTDRIFVGTSFTSGCRDGYCGSTSRPANLPQCVVVDLGAACFDGTLPTSGILQMFVDDFQPRVWGSLFQVTINGKRASQIEDGMNLLAQTGPIGKLMSFTLTPEQLALLQSGTVTVCVDDPTTHQGDGFALDFVKLLIDAYGTDYQGTISGTVTAFGTNTPIAGAIVSAGGVVSTTTAANGTYTLANVPAGFVYVFANAPGYETTGQVVDLPNAQTRTVNFSMRPNQAPVITSTPGTHILVGSTYSYDVNATDADGDSLTYGIPQSPPGMTFNEFTGLITWAPTAAQVGTWPISVEVNDRRGGVAVQSFNIEVGAANVPPTVSCQPDLHLIGSSAKVTIYCSVTDDGQVIGAPTPEWYFGFKGDQAPTLTAVGSDRANIELSAPGVYEFVLTANDGQFQESDSVIVTLSPTLTPPLTVFAGADKFTPESTVNLAGIALGGNGSPSVEWSQVDGPALAQIATPVAQSTDVTLPNSGTYRFRLTATDGFSTESDDVTVVVVQPATGVPFNPTQGWIGSPLHASTVTGLVPITVAQGVRLTAGTVRYWPMSAPNQVHVLATGVTGDPGATIATLDTTVLANGPWVIQLDATNSAGESEVSLVAVTVSGDYKPGRVVVEVTDMTIPVTGIPITVGRRYDSVEKDNVGDFGHGWSLMLGHPRLEVDPSHNVTITMPDNRRVTFYFTPSFPAAGPIVFGFLLLPAYTPQLGTYGSLTADGCPVLSFNPYADVANPTCFGAFSPEELPYAPTTYTYTDPYGRVFTMGAGGELRSIKDRQQNVLTFTPNGITSSTGLAVTFDRDALGRITKVTSPAVDTDGGTVVHRYEYAAAGNLSKCIYPDDSNALYTYSSAHLLLTTKDNNGNLARASTYDTAGRLIRDADALGNVTLYAYDVAAHQTTITNPDLGIVERTFDARGLLLKEVDPLGRITEHSYDSNRNESTRRNAQGEVSTFTYDAKGNQTSLSNQRGDTTTIIYNAFSQPLTSKDPERHTTTFEYGELGIPTKFKDEIGTLATFTSSERGLPLSVTDGAGEIAYIDYDEAGNPTFRTDRLGRQTRSTYDGVGRLTKTTDPRGGAIKYEYLLRGPASRMVDATGIVGHSARDFAYDANLNLISESSDEGRVTNYTYDALNHLLKVEHTDHASIEYTRDFRGNPLTETDQLGRTKTYEYDKAGQLRKTIFPDGTFTTREYDALGRLVSATDERGNTTTYAYEAGCGCADRVTKVTDPIGRSIIATYDAVGRRLSVTDASGHATSYEYDARGRLTKTTHADSSTEIEEYDALDRHTVHTDQMGSVTRYGYDAEGQLVAVTDASGKVTQYGYDPSGNLTRVTDANGHATTYAFDALNRKIRRTMPRGMSETFGYNMYGDTTSHVDFRGKTTALAYDVLGRLATKTPDPTLGEPTIIFNYNLIGTRSKMNDASGETNYEYDARDRLITKATPQGTLRYTYDSAGNLATIRSSNPNGTSVDYGWDSANQLTSVTDNAAGGITTSAYTATGRPGTVSQPNGVNGSYGYDNRDRATSVAWQQGTGSAFGTWSYGFNGRGQRLSLTDITGRSVAYGYDAVSRLVKETISGGTGSGEITYALDPVGNRLSRTSSVPTVPSTTYAYDANDQLESDGYDLNGNTTSAEGHTYAYDFEDRLLSKDGGAVTLVYDGDGNRVAKTVGGVTTRYLVDELNPTGYLQVVEETAAGSVQVAYTYGAMVMSQRRVGAGGAVSYYGYDAQGNITFLTDETGAVTDSYEYDAWGDLLAQTGTTPNRRLYTGEEWDPELGLYNLRARQYNPSTGRFLTIDPIMGDLLAPVSLNRYLYTGADPVNFADPTGRAKVLRIGGGVSGEYIALVGMGLTVAAMGVTILAQGIYKYYQEVPSKRYAPDIEPEKPGCGVLLAAIATQCLALQAAGRSWEAVKCYGRLARFTFKCLSLGFHGIPPGGF